MEAKTEPETAPGGALKINEEKWSKPLMAAGWTVIPNVIIERQLALGLDAIDINILMHLAARWWKADNKPFPSKTTIATAMNVDPRTVQRRIAKMEHAGFVRREERRVRGMGSKTNIYHLDGLIAAAKPYAEEMLSERAEREKERRARAARKRARKPKLHVVGDGSDADE